MEAISDRGEHLRWEAGGRRDARAEVDRIVDHVAAGITAAGAVTVAADDDAASRDEPDSRLARAVGIVALVCVLAGVRFGVEVLAGGSPSCPVPGPTRVEPMAPTWPAAQVDAGPLSLDDAAGGKYGSDARRAALESGALVDARYEDWQFEGDVIAVRDLTFATQADAIGFAAVDAESICGFLESTFEPAGLPGAAGVRQPWRTGPPGWWAGAVAQDRYVRAYVRTWQEDRGAILVADALRRSLGTGR